MARDLVDILPDYDTKIGNMSAKVLAARDAESAGYAHYMAKQLAASEAQREENRKLAEIRKQRHGIDSFAQAPSTRAILARPKEDDEKHFLRPLVDCQIRDKDGNIDVGERPVTIEEVSHIEAIRRRPKNSTGQSEKSATGKENQEAAIHTYLCSPPAVLSEEELKRVTKPQVYETKPLVVTAPPPPKPSDKTFWTHGHFLELKNWFKRK
jgi:hypothetical protein